MRVPQSPIWSLPHLSPFCYYFLRLKGSPSNKTQSSRAGYSQGISYMANTPLSSQLFRYSKKKGTFIFSQFSIPSRGRLWLDSQMSRLRSDKTNVGLFEYFESWNTNFFRKIENFFLFLWWVKNVMWVNFTGKWNKGWNYLTLFFTKPCLNLTSSKIGGGCHHSINSGWRAVDQTLILVSNRESQLS